MGPMAGSWVEVPGSPPVVPVVLDRPASLMPLSRIPIAAGEPVPSVRVAGHGARPVAGRLLQPVGGLDGQPDLPALVEEGA
jgi:hypothetical protein